MNVEIAYYANGSLHTAQVGEVITNFPDSELAGLLERGIVTLVEQPIVEVVPAVVTPKSRKRKE